MFNVFVMSVILVQDINYLATSKIMDNIRK